MQRRRRLRKISYKKTGSHVFESPESAACVREKKSIDFRKQALASECFDYEAY